jgi:hypothetical protein
MKYEVARASGYVVKVNAGSELASAVEAVFQGKRLSVQIKRMHFCRHRGYPFGPFIGGELAFASLAQKPRRHCVRKYLRSRGRLGQSGVAHNQMILGTSPITPLHSS